MWCLAFVALTQMFGTLGTPIRLGSDGSTYFSWGNPNTQSVTLQAVNKDGSFKWTFHANATIMDPFPTIKDYGEGLNGTIYVATSSGLYALNGTDGSIQWQHIERSYTDGRIQLAISYSTMQSAPAVFLQRIYDHGSSLEAIDVNGALKWVEHFNTSIGMGELTDPSIEGTLMVDPTGHFVYTGDKYFLTQLNLNGQTRWTFTSGSHYNKYTLSKEGGVFVAQGREAPFDPAGRQSESVLNLLRLSDFDGRVLWNVSGGFSAMTTTLTAGPHIGAPILGSNGEVYVTGMTDKDGVCNFRAFDVDGNPLRVLPCHDFRHLTKRNENGTEEDIFVAARSDPALSHSTTSVIAYSGASGRLLWNLTLPFPLPAPASASGLGSLKTGPNGTIFFITENDPQMQQPWHRTASVIRDGEEAWRMIVDSWYAHDDPGHMLMAEDGTTYNLLAYGHRHGRGCSLEAFDMNGVQKWNYTPPVYPLLV